MKRKNHLSQEEVKAIDALRNKHRQVASSEGFQQKSFNNNGYHENMAP